MSTEEVW